MQYKDYSDVFDLETTDIFFYDQILKNKNDDYYFEIKFMNTDEYIGICSQFHDCSVENEYKMIDEDNLEHLLDVVKKEKLPIPFLNFIKKEQEGRHRVVLAKRLGINNIPIVCFYKKL